MSCSPQSTQCNFAHVVSCMFSSLRSSAEIFLFATSPPLRIILTSRAGSCCRYSGLASVSSRDWIRSPVSLPSRERICGELTLEQRRADSIGLGSENASGNHTDLCDKPRIRHRHLGFEPTNSLTNNVYNGCVASHYWRYLVSDGFLRPTG